MIDKVNRCLARYSLCHNSGDPQTDSLYIFLAPAEVVSAGYTWRSLAVMWSKVFVGLLMVNIVTLAIWLALTESDSNVGGEVDKEGCLHVKQVIF